MKKKKSKLNDYLDAVQWSDIYIGGESTNYQISNDGRVKNKVSKHILRLSTDKKGYICADLYVDGKRYRKFVHRLVAFAFIPNPFNKPDINHRDTVKTNNWWWNLEWCTPKENVHHTINMGNKPVGEACSFSKYTEEQIHHVCRLLEKDEDTLVSIESKTGVVAGTIWDIKAGNIWVHISGAYDIPLPIPDRKGKNHHSTKQNEETIRQVCELLMDPKRSFDEVINMTGVVKSDINNITQGKAWVHISSEYNIPKRERSMRARVIRKLIEDGLDTSSIIGRIMVEFDIPDRAKARQYVKSVRNYYNLSCSTTIPKSDHSEKSVTTGEEEVHPQANGGPLEELKVG